MDDFLKIDRVVKSYWNDSCTKQMLVVSELNLTIREGELVAFEHYVPVKDDLSDIEEVFDWCLTHPDSCEEIAHNGKRYIEAFLDTARETEILRRIISAYLSKAPYRLRFGPMERLLQTLPRRSGMAVSI